MKQARNWLGCGHQISGWGRHEKKMLLSSIGMVLNSIFPVANLTKNMNSTFTFACMSVSNDAWVAQCAEKLKALYFVRWQSCSLDEYRYIKTTLKLASFTNNFLNMTLSKVDFIIFSFFIFKLLVLAWTSNQNAKHWKTAESRIGAVPPNQLAHQMMLNGKSQNKEKQRTLLLYSGFEADSIHWSTIIEDGFENIF